MASSEHEEEAHGRLLPQLGLLLRPLLASPVGKTLVLLAVALFVIIVATAYDQIILNRWNRPFYDAISRRDFFGFLVQLGVFCLIAGTLLVLNVAQTWLQEMLKLKLREGLVRDLLYGWMVPRRALMIANAGVIGVNPDQRMHEDARRLCELSSDLGGGLLQSSILLITFVGVLWVLSRGFSIHVGSRDYPIPGYMVWAALLYAGLGSLLSYRVGRTLIPRNAERYGQEADLRFSLVRVNEHLDGISLARGEAGEIRRIELHFAGVLLAMRRLVTGLTNLTWIKAGFGWLTNVAPIIVSSPLYFQGRLSFGGLMMAAAAFSQAQSSLSWFVNNFSSIADWRATLLRVASFRRALLEADTIGPDESRIDYAEGEPGVMLLEDLELASSSDRDVLDEKHVVIRAGERVLILAAPGTGKTRLFRALAGLWPWGSGRITRPRGEQIQYLPRGTPYLPRGSLREVLAYPTSVDTFTEHGYAQALQRVGLERLVPMLDQTHRWDRELTPEDLLGIAFARIVLQRPQWLIVDNTLGSLDGETLERVIDIFSHELSGISVIHIGSAAARDPLFSRVIHLVKPPRAQRYLRPVALLLALGVLWPVLSRAAAPAEQNFPFSAPTVLNDARTALLMRDLAVRVLPVYVDPQRDRYLTNLSVLQMVAGDYQAADATRLALRARLKGATPAQSAEQSVAYDIYAHTEALEARSHTPFGQAFTQSFGEVIPRLDNLTDYAVSAWFQTSLSVFQDALSSALQRARARQSIAMPEALQLVWDYLAYQIHLATGPQADELIAADDQRRYITDEDVLIKTAGGVGLAATLVRPRDARPLPTLLEFTIYDYPDNDAKECAAHGYVGVVAYSRGKRINRGKVMPYEHDGDDARSVIQWIAKQPWSDGRVGMYGSGYSAFAAWAAAKLAPRALTAIATASALAPGINTPDRDSIFLNSAYRWARYVSGTPDLNDAAYDDQAHWLQLNRTWYRSGRPYDELSRIDGQPNPVFDRWLTHPAYDRYWQAMIPYQGQFAHIDLPVLAITGYYDSDEPADLYYFTEHYRYDHRADHTLVIGPYDDSVTQGTPEAALGGYSLDPAALIDWHQLRYQWFDSIFNGGPKPALLQGRVNYEVMGANRWQQAPSIEAMANHALRFFLDPSSSDLRATGGHLLAARAPPSSSALEQTVDFADRSDADWIAPAAIQGATLPTHYSLVFVSTPIAQAMQLNGLISGQLEFTTNKRDFDFSLALYERLPDGSTLQLSRPPDDYRASYVADRSHRHLLSAGPRQRLQFRGEHLMSHALPAGSRLVLVLSIDKRPDQQINYGTGGNVSQESVAAAKVALRIRWLGSSYVDLPVQMMPASPAPSAPHRPASAPLPSR